MKKIIITLALLSALTAGAFGQTTAEEWFARGVELYNNRDFANAVTAYSEVIRRDSSNLDAYWLRGNCYHGLHNYDAAISDYSTVIRGAPDFPDVYASRGYMYGANNMYSRMIADYRMSLEKGFDPSQFIIDKSDIADMWFGGTIYMDIVINRFISNTATVTRNENWLRTFCDRNRVTRAEIETFYRNNIRALVSQVVDEEFQKTRGGWIPYNVYVNSGKGEAIVGIKEVITQFFLNPNTNNYFAIYFSSDHFSVQVSRGNSFAKHAGDAYDAAVRSLSPVLMDKLNIDMLNRIAIPATVQNDPAVRKVTQNTPSGADLLREAQR